MDRDGREPDGLVAHQELERCTAQRGCSSAELREVQQLNRKGAEGAAEGLLFAATLLDGIALVRALPAAVRAAPKLLRAGADGVRAVVKGVVTRAGAKRPLRTSTSAKTPVQNALGHWTKHAKDAAAFGRARNQHLSSLAAAALVLSCGGGDDPDKGKPITQVPASAVFFHADLHGSPLAVTSAKGDVVRQVSYHAYGAERFHSGRAEPRSFVGKERDAGSGLSDFGARAYRPELGIFVSPDPVAVFEPEEGIGDPRRLLPYSYGGGDPITQVDPSGRIFDTIVDIGFVAYDLYRIGADNVFGNEETSAPTC